MPSVLLLQLEVNASVMKDALECAKCRNIPVAFKPAPMPPKPERPPDEQSAHKLSARSEADGRGRRRDHGGVESPEET